MPFLNKELALECKKYCFLLLVLMFCRKPGYVASTSLRLFKVTYWWGKNVLIINFWSCREHVCTFAFFNLPLYSLQGNVYGAWVIFLSECVTFSSDLSPGSIEEWLVLMSMKTSWTSYKKCQISTEKYH